MKVEEITDPSAVQLALAKTGIDNQLNAVLQTDTALFAAHSMTDSYILLQHNEEIHLWRLTGDITARCAYKKELEDKMALLQNGVFKPGDNVEYYRERFIRP